MATVLAGSSHSRRYSYGVVAVLSLVYTMSFLDRQILSVLAEPIKAELGFSDTELGMLSGMVFALFYSLFGIPIAWLADRSSRVRIVAICCALWSLFAASCGLVTSFAQMAIARVGVAVGEGGGSPASYSIISDYFPPQRRGTALAVYSLGAPLGTAIGASVGGWLASVYGWRTAFIVTGLAGLPIALIVLFSVKEPRRGATDQAVSAPLADATVPPLRETFAMFLRDPVLRWTTVGAALSAFVGYALLSWSPAFLMREKGMAMGEIAAYYSVAAGVSVAIGTFLSGWLVDRLGAVSPRAYGLVPGAAFLIATPFLVAMVYAPTWQTSLALMIIPMMMYIMWLAPALATIQNTVPANQRGTSSAIMVFLAGVFGMGLGPVFVGVVSDANATDAQAGALGVGMLALTPFFLFAAIAHYQTARSLLIRASQSRA